MVKESASQNGDKRRLLCEQRDRATTTRTDFGGSPIIFKADCVWHDLSESKCLIRVHYTFQEFLSTNKVVHRDLAARNILLSGRNRILKISDFGLSRDVYEQNLYKISSKGSIPVKWLAPECLLKDVYTMKSDVWSYSILLWEIFTYGGCPYPGVSTNNVFDLLKNGYRMDRPEHCPEDVYELMRTCWEEEPCDRPDFTAIRLILEDIIEKTTQVTYLNLETGTGSQGDENYRNTGHEPPLPPSRKPLPRIPFQRMDENY
ncbi:Fibroblast growth factor receptor 3 [Orchesella cincta]|uniref:Fibroblast growth factor receptor 3 n=1 Tax=Orchesella cincta TaxID=48709 RepID=A0A1D2NJE8_ORCCI|nr:Fibroblast growth factor receptor 3 [Orchesella cincta]